MRSYPMVSRIQRSVVVLAVCLVGCGHADAPSGFKPPNWFAGPEIATTQGILVVTGVQFSKGFPPGCTGGPACLKSGSGDDLLGVWLVPKDGRPPSALSTFIRETFLSVAVVSTASGAITQATGGGLFHGHLALVFAPGQTESSWTLSWPGNPPIALPPAIYSDARGRGPTARRSVPAPVSTNEVSSSAAAVTLEISGSIKNFEDFAALIIPDTYIQLVSKENLHFNTDSQHRVFLHNPGRPGFSRLPVPERPTFQFTVPNVAPGQYLLVAQLLKARDLHVIPGVVPPAVKPAFEKDEKVFIIDIPAGASSPFEIVAGDLTLPVTKAEATGKSAIADPAEPPAAVTGPGGFTFTATIGNLQAAKERCGVTKDSYLELMRVRPKGEKKSSVPEESPKAYLSTNKIVLKAKALIPGQYLIAVQKTYCGGFMGPINIAPDAKTPFRVDLGVMNLPAR
jgi:hypothetical protein